MTASAAEPAPADVRLGLFQRGIPIIRSMRIPASAAELALELARQARFLKLDGEGGLCPERRMRAVRLKAGGAEMRAVMTQRVTEDMIIGDMLEIDPGIGPILMASGMHCIGCPASQGESLAEAAMVHGLKSDELVETVNSYLAKKE